MRSKLLRKILFSILGTIIVIYWVVVFLITSEAYYITEKNAENYTINNLKSLSKFFSQVIEKDINIVRTVRDAIQDFYQLETRERLKLQRNILINVLESNQQFLSLAVSWEINALDTTYHKEYGRYRYLYYWQSGKIVEKIDSLNIDGDDITSLYYQYKISKRPGLTQIYTDTYTGRKEDEILMTSIVEPIIKNDRFLGLVSSDISLDRMQEIVNNINPFENSKTILFSHNGRIIASTGDEKPLTKFLSILPADYKDPYLFSKLADNETVVFRMTDSLENQFFVAILPVKFENYSETWGIATFLPLKIIVKETQKLVRISLIGAILGFIIIVIITLTIATNIVNPINSIVEILKELSDRNIDPNLKLKIKSKDEIGEISKSVNELIDALLEVTTFASEIGKGNLSVKLELAGDRDVLGKALIEMQKSLKIAKLEDQKRQDEEKIQRWIIEGEAKFAEILRQYNQDIEQLAYHTIKNLVNYVEALQGGLFIINDDDKENPYIELVASYAYGRRRYLKKKIPMGIGLIGRSILEGESIYLTDIPEDYTNISSGLGESKPKTLLIVPFKFNEVIYAVVELASLKDFKPYVRQFIERVGVSVASTIANVKISTQTTKLVEELKKRTQELTTQEEEMRQNLEEMKVTQEELRRKAQEYENIVDALNQVSFVLEYDMDRRLINVNQRFLDFMGLKKEDILGTKLGAYMVDPNKEKILDELWEDLKYGKIRTITQHHKIGNREFYFAEAYIPIFDEQGKPYKVINIINDITSIMQRKK